MQDAFLQIKQQIMSWVWFSVNAWTNKHMRSVLNYATKSRFIQNQ